MKKKPSSPKSGTPLNTQDVTRLAGTSRRVLDRYEQTGLLVPRRLDAGIKARKQWSIDQAKLTDYVRILQHGDLSIEQIAALADEGIDVFLSATEAQCAQDMREARRQCKASIKDARRCRGSRRSAQKEGLYLRHFPQRWMMIAPIMDAVDVLPASSDCADLFVELYSVAHVVGWCPTGGAGIVASVAEAPASDFSAYAFVELASPPMPATRTGELLDGGCYRSLCKGEDGLECDGPCAECTHFGRNPTTEERFRWNACESDNPGLWDKVLMAEDMERPYAYGIWSDEPISESDLRSVNAYRPRLMPHTLRLPLGITCCCMPEGAYLCSQCAEGDEAEAYQRLRGTMMAVPHRAFTEEDERRLCEYRGSQTARPPHQPASPPFQASFPATGITDLSSLPLDHDLEYTDLHRLTVPTGMALPPEDGFCVACSLLPGSDRNEVPRLELRVFVDAKGFMPDELGQDHDLSLWP